MAVSARLCLLLASIEAAQAIAARPLCQASARARVRLCERPVTTDEFIRPWSAGRSQGNISPAQQQTPVTAVVPKRTEGNLAKSVNGELAPVFDSDMLATVAVLGLGSVVLLGFGFLFMGGGLLLLGGGIFLLGGGSMPALAGDDQKVVDMPRAEEEVWSSIEQS